MAFKYNFPTQFGVDATYHKVSAIHVYTEDRIAHIDVQAFLSEDGTVPVMIRQIELSGDIYPFDESISIEIAESAVQKLPEYGGTK